MKGKTRCLGWIFFILLFFLTACGNQNSQVDHRNLLSEPLADHRFLIGTHVSITIFDAQKEEVFERAFQLVEDLGNKIDVNNPVDSEIQRVNQAAGEHPVVVSQNVFYMVQDALEISKASGGKFDMSIGPLTSLWRIGFPDARRPTQEEIDERLPLINYQNIVLDENEHSIFLKKKGMSLDLGAVGKGWITDEVAKYLKEHGVTTAILDFGGNVYVIGYSWRGEETPWNVGIQDPNQARNTTIGTLPGVNQTFVTSGVYERFLEVDDVLYPHILNPETGFPFNNDIAGVTIIGDVSLEADILSTTVFALGLKDGFRFIENRDGVDAIFITKEGRVYVTSGIENTFQLSEGNGYTMGESAKLKE